MQTMQNKLKTALELIDGHIEPKDSGETLKRQRIELEEDIPKLSVVTSPALDKEVSIHSIKSRRDEKWAKKDRENCGFNEIDDN